VTERLLESALEGEITDQLGYDKHDPAGKDSGNSRNGKGSKPVLTEVGPVETAMPRDRDGSFEPKIVKKRRKRLSGVDEMVISLPSPTRSWRAEWQNRPLDAVYPVVFIDAIHVEIRDGAVANRPVHVALAVIAEGRREILGLWAGDGGEGAKHWIHILTEIKNHGVADVLMLVCEG
jgi:transposase-like protein